MHLIKTELQPGTIDSVNLSRKKRKRNKRDFKRR